MKKVNVISVRLDEDAMAKISAYASWNEWTIAHAVRKLCAIGLDYLINNGLFVLPEKEAP